MLTEVMRLYTLRHWVGQDYKKMKDQLGCADFMVRSDRAIRRHWVLVCCAFAFCWWQEAQQARLHNLDSLPMRKKPACAFANALPLVTPAAFSAGMVDTAALATRCWRACFAKPLPPELATLVQFLIGEDGLNLHLRLQRTTTNLVIPDQLAAISLAKGGF